MYGGDTIASPEFKVIGDKKLRRKFKKMRDVILRSAGRKAMNFALTPINAEAKKRVTVITGTLKKSIGKKVKAYKFSKVIIGLVGVRLGFKKEVDGKLHRPEKYGHLVEFGSKGKSGKPFLRPALDAKKNEAFRRYGSKLAEAIEKTWRD